MLTPQRTWWEQRLVGVGSAEKRRREVVAAAAFAAEELRWGSAEMHHPSHGL